MKDILKLSLILVLLFAFNACSEDDDLQVSETSFGNILAPTDGQTVVLNPLEEQTNTAITVSWENANYSSPTEVNYSVQIAQQGTDFASPIVIGTTTSNSASVNIANFNNYVIQAGLSPFIEGFVDLRIKATLGDNDDLPQYTSSIVLSVTPFTTDLPKIAIPGNHQGWTPSTAPLMASSAFGASDYIGYAWLDGEYKFIAPDELGEFDWGNTDWGDDGNFNGVLVETDEVNCNAETAGYYFVEADTNELTYSITPVSWGIIGEATPSGWDADTDLIYNSTTMTLEIDIDLSPGAFKFRGNNEWGAFDLGTVDGDGFLQNGGDLTFDGSAGNYHVVLDLSNPREYTYTITEN